MAKAWKELEKKTAAALGGIRINRALDYGHSDYDVVVPDFPFLRVDAKHRKRHAHHSLIEEIRDKYCKGGGYPVLVTRHSGSHRQYVCLDLHVFGAILQVLRQYNNQKEKNNEDDSRVSEGGEGAV